MFFTLLRSRRSACSSRSSGRAEYGYLLRSPVPRFQTMASLKAAWRSGGELVDAPCVRLARVRVSISWPSTMSRRLNGVKICCCCAPRRGRGPGSDDPSIFGSWAGVPRGSGMASLREGPGRRRGRRKGRRGGMGRALPVERAGGEPALDGVRRFTRPSPRLREFAPPGPRVRRAAAAQVGDAAHRPGGARRART